MKRYCLLGFPMNFTQKSSSFSAMRPHRFASASGFELHLMSHAFKKDCDDTDRKGTTGDLVELDFVRGS